MEHALSLDVIHVVEMAAIAAAKAMGSGDKEYADRLATETLRAELSKLDIHARIVIGEGERDEAPMLYVGEELGLRSSENAEYDVDIAVDPLENTNAAANGTANAIVTLAMAERGGMLHAPDVYMDKIVVGPTARGSIDINKSPSENIKNIAEAYRRDPSEITVVILDRERHGELISEVRSTGARIKLIPDGDLSGGIAAAFRGTGVHCVMGAGGSPEGVLTAAAMKCLGGEIQGRLVAYTDAERERLRKLGYTDLSRVYHTEDLVPGNNVIFAATGVTHGDLLKGVRMFAGGIRTETLIISNTERKIRFIDTVHGADGRQVAVPFRG
jgi:fructose-1,6-bisphosphatase class II